MASDVGRIELDGVAVQYGGFDGPTNVLETLKAADTQTDWSKVDLSKTSPIRWSSL